MKTINLVATLLFVYGATLGILPVAYASNASGGVQVIGTGTGLPNPGQDDDCSAQYQIDAIAEKAEINADIDGAQQCLSGEAHRLTDYQISGSCRHYPWMSVIVSVDVVATYICD